MNSSYHVVYLPVARRDMVDIVDYISHELKNPDAAERLAVQMVEAIEGLTDFPYACPVYLPIRPLAYEYRKLRVQHYLIFYWVDERQKIITIARVIYEKRYLPKQF